MSAPVELVEVSKRYGRHWALRSVTLVARPHEILGLVGPNGAGKTTLLRIAAGLLRPGSGDVRRNGMVQTPALRYFAGERALPPDVPAKRWLRLWTGQTSDNFGRRHVGALSRGMRQRLGLETTLSSLSGLSSVVLLDEPWEGLDPDAARWLSDQLVEKRNAGAAVVVSSHRIHDLADVCDRCVFLSKGQVVDEIVMPSTVGVGIDRPALLFEAFDRLRGTPS